MTRPAPSCFTEDNTRADGFSGHEIYRQMTSGPGTGSAQLAANTATSLESSYSSVEQRLKRVGETLGESWTGASADAAQAAGNPINQAMIQMQDALRQADTSLSNQVYQFNYNKAQLKNMPSEKPDTGFWDDVTPWDTDTEDAVNGYNSDEAHNRKVYSEFQSASNTNRGELPKEFPGVTADNLNIEIAETGGDDGRDKTANVSNTGRPPGTTNGFPTSTSQQTSTGTGWTGPGGINGGETNVASVGTENTVRPGENTGRPPVGGVIERPPNTGIPPIGVPGNPNLTGTGPGRGPGGGPGGGPGKFGGGPGSGGPGGSRFGGGGLGGSGTGLGAGNAGSAGQQAGGKAGVFGGMGESANARGGAAGAAGAGGRAGAAGMGGMAGQGQRGQGEDDLEHKSADYLVNEENTNEIIGDMPLVAPPTIGG